MPSIRSRLFVFALPLALLLSPGSLAAQWTSADGVVVERLDRDPAAGPGGAPVALPLERRVEEKAAFIVQYDDGEVDTGFGASSAVKTQSYALLFDGVGGPDVTFDAFELCMFQSSGDTSIRFEVVVWDDDGPGGAPGTELASFPAFVTGVGTTPGFYNVSTGVEVTGDVYIGVRYNPIVDEGYFFCVDSDNPEQPGYKRQGEGGWSPETLASYSVYMFRGFFSTPGVVAEALVVPFFEVDTRSGAGTTTLFAVRNVSDAPVSADIGYYDVAGNVLRMDTVSLDPEEVVTVNLRDVPGLVVDGDGFARGFVDVFTSGNPDGTPVLAGDFIQVDVGQNFATGERTPRLFDDVCDIASVRFLDFGVPTELGIWLAAPRGTGAGDPPSFSMDIFDEAGILADSWSIKSSTHVVQLDVSGFTAERFGSIVFDFSNGGGGVVYAESSAGGRFSVGIGSECERR